MTLYDELKAAGVALSNHESDLYCESTPQAREILARWPLEKSNARGFINQAPPHKGEHWLDIPFAFHPWWQARVNYPKAI